MYSVSLYFVAFIPVILGVLVSGVIVLRFSKLILDLRLQITKLQHDIVVAEISTKHILDTVSSIAARRDAEISDIKHDLKNISYDLNTLSKFPFKSA
jgi:glycine cleavage system regulatory protein